MKCLQIDWCVSHAFSSFHHLQFVPSSSLNLRVDSTWNVYMYTDVCHTFSLPFITCLSWYMVFTLLPFVFGDFFSFFPLLFFPLFLSFTLCVWFHKICLSVSVLLFASVFISLYISISLFLYKSVLLSLSLFTQILNTLLIFVKGKLELKVF